MPFPPTAEQRAIIAAARETPDNLIITALAGAAKTSTLVLIAEALPSTRILCLAFNKKIALEMADRLPDNCTASTLNALGHRIWSEALGRRLQVNMKKMYSLTREYIETFPKPEAKPLWAGFKEILATAKEAKAYGYIPAVACEEFAAKRPHPLSGAEFYTSCEYELTSAEQTAVDTILLASIREAFEGQIDFDDQIYMSTLFRAIFPPHPLVLVDEAQDLSVLNHEFLRKLARRRLIAVGDPCQAIYGFRGAHETSMDLLAEAFSMSRLALTTSFRVPPVHVEHVKWRAPAMRAWSDNPYSGCVTSLSTWSVIDIPDSAAIICRNNAPLYRLAITLLQMGRTPKLANNALGKTLVNLLKKLGPPNMDRKTALGEVLRWKTDRLKRTRAKATIRDQAECMAIFIRATDSLGAATQFATDLFRYEGAVNFLTGHKAKGLEFPHVYFLDQDLIGEEGQDPNIRYVICTRAQESLTYITTDGCLDLLSPEEIEYKAIH